MTSSTKPAEHAGSAISILEMLPHRFPLVMVDRVLSCEPGQYIEGIKNVAVSEPLIAVRSGSLPSLLIIEALAQLSVILTFRTLAIEPTGKELMFFAGIDKAHIHSPAIVGDQLLLRSELKRLRRGVGRYVGRCTIQGRLALEADIMAAWRA